MCKLRVRVVEVAIEPERLRAASHAIYLESINRVIDHIDRHLDEDLPLSELASVAGFSDCHFHRIFRALTAETLSQFVTRLRLERALWTMRHAPASLSQIAIDCGFGSLSNFSRTFKKEYGSSPSKIKLASLLKDRKIGQTHPDASRYHFHEFSRDDRTSELLVSIAAMDDLPIAYIRCYGLYIDPQEGIDAYHRLMAWARSNPSLTANSKVIGMSVDDPEITPQDKYRYDLCVTLDRPIRPSGEIGTAVIPAARYAVHHCKGDIHAVDHAWSYLFKVWFPQSGYRPAHQPAMEIFHSRPEEVGWDYFDIECCVPIDPIAGLTDD